MKKKDKDFICAKIDNNGFDYVFVDYSSFDEVKDEEFHRLREAYVKAQKELENYIGWNEFL